LCRFAFPRSGDSLNPSTPVACHACPYPNSDGDANSYAECAVSSPYRDGVANGDAGFVIYAHSYSNAYVLP
jgi:hypothetical protein